MGRKASVGFCGESNPSYKHGHNKRGCRSPEYKIWVGLRKRVNNSNDVLYPYYGGRGITYDPTWDNFDCFLSDVGKRPVGHSLDRIDNNGNYCKDNVRWVTQADQNRNKRNNILVEGVVLKDWCEQRGFKYKRVWVWYKVQNKSLEEIAKRGEALWGKDQILKETQETITKPLVRL